LTNKTQQYPPQPTNLSVQPKKLCAVKNTYDQPNQPNQPLLSARSNMPRNMQVAKRKQTWLDEHAVPSKLAKQSVQLVQLAKPAKPVNNMVAESALAGQTDTQCDLTNVWLVVGCKQNNQTNQTIQTILDLFQQHSIRMAKAQPKAALMASMTDLVRRAYLSRLANKPVWLSGVRCVATRPHSLLVCANIVDKANIIDSSYWPSNIGTPAEAIRRAKQFQILLAELVRQINSPLLVSIRLANNNAHEAASMQASRLAAKVCNNQVLDVWFVMSWSLHRNPTAQEVTHFVQNFVENKKTSLDQQMRKHNPLTRFDDYCADLQDLTCWSVRWSRNAKFSKHNNAFGYFNLLCTAKLHAKDVHLYYNQPNALTVGATLDMLAEEIYDDNPDGWYVHQANDECIIAGPDQFDRLALSGLRMHVV
jgi:hypothetical protein